MIPTFLYRQADLSESIISLIGSEAHHITGVLRLDRGDMIRLIDGKGTAHICEIASIASKMITARIIKTLKNSGEPGLHLTMAIGLSTSSKFDTVIEKGTEAGVCCFVPLLTEKGKVKLGDKAAITRKMKRWYRVCEAAVKQSGRSRIPEICEPIELDKFLESCEPAETALFHPGEWINDIAAMTNLKNKSRMTILVGPESGFSSAELQSVRNRSIVLISMGSRVLRTETAGTVLPALVIYLSERAKA